MKKYQCNSCPYIYDPEKGEPATGVKSGTPWEDVPEDWYCPVCGAPKADFYEIEESS